MTSFRIPLAALFLLGALTACGGEPETAGEPAMDEGAAPAESPEGGALASADAPSCQPMTEQMALEGRLSPYDSLRFQVGAAQALLCYGRPSSRGRTMIGGENVPFGRLWRTGANEPTTLHLPFAAEVAGVAVEPGSYTIYTVPGETEWEVIINASTTQWGHEGRYTPEVEAQEVGRGAVPAEATDEHVETLTFRAEPADGGADLILEWENSRVRIPVRARGG